MRLSAKRSSSSGGVARGEGIRRTFETLVSSRAPGAREVLLSGLEQDDPHVQLTAARAIIESRRRGGMRDLIETFDRLVPEAADELIRHLDDFIFPLRETLLEGSVEARRNAVDIIIRAEKVKLAYLLVQALSDPDETTSSAALTGLRRLAENYHRQVERARTGEIDLSRTEIENKKFALIDPVMSLLGNLSRRQPDELLLLAMGLDMRTNDLLFAILNSKQDPRTEKLTRLMWHAAGEQVISFLLDCLRDRRASNAAVAVIQKRRDEPFVKGLLLNDRFFTDYRVRDVLKLIHETEFLKAGGDGASASSVEPRPFIFQNALLTLRGVHFLVLSGVERDEKVRFLESVSTGRFPLFVRGIAESMVEALRAGREIREISLALQHFENVMGTGPDAETREVPGKIPSALEMPELELPWAHPETEVLPTDAFTQFFNMFDELDEATRLLATAVLKRLDREHVTRIREELASLEGDRRLKAVKIVVMFHREQEVEETLLRLTRDPDRHVRATVVKTLGVLEDEPAIRGLLQAVSDVDRRVVANSVEALEAVGRQELLGLVKIFAEHPNNRIRANAVKALWTMGDPEAEGRLDAMLSSESDMMRLSAAWLLGEIDHPRRTDMLMKLARDDQSDHVRLKARQILGERD